MRKYLLALLLVANVAFSAPFTIEIDDKGACKGVWSFSPKDANTFVVSCNVGAPPVVVTTPPPITPTTSPTTTVDLCKNYSARIYLGELKFDGTQLNSADMVGNTIAYAKLVIPPVEGQKQASATVLANGNATSWRKVVLSKTPCDFTGIPAQGLTATVYLSTTNQKPGETWYINIKNEMPFGGNSCGPGQNCAFGIRVYPFN